MIQIKNLQVITYFKKKLIFKVSLRISHKI